MFRQTQRTTQPVEPQAGRPSESGESWLGHNRSEKRRLWERLNPPHRKQLRVLAEALAIQQYHAQLPESVRTRLDAAVVDLGRISRRLESILAEVARRTPGAG